MAPISGFSSSSSPSRLPPANSSPVAKIAKDTFCHRCHKETFTLCGRCNLIYYCSIECQKVDRDTHKEFCKPPGQVLVKITTLDQYGNPLIKEVPIKVWDAGQIEAVRATGPIRDTIFTESQTVYNAMRDVEFRGNVMVGCSANVVDFSMRFLEPAALNQLRREYDGLDRSIEEFVHRQDYIEILKRIWVEEDLPMILAVLKPYAEAGHAILMLEYSRTLCRQMKKEASYPEEKVQEAYKWVVLGLAHTQMDIACCDDPTLGEAFKALQWSYKPVWLLPPAECSRLIPERIQFTKEIFNAYRLPDSLPSPEWLIFCGKMILSGVKAIKPAIEWPMMRAQKFDEFKNS